MRLNRKNSSNDVPRMLGMTFAQGVALLYLLVAGLWIYFSDKLAEWLTETASQLRLLSIYKGWFFVVVTAGLLFLVLKRFIFKTQSSQQQLRESEEEFRNLAESMPQIVWATRTDGWNVYFNQQWVDYTGMTLEESYGHGWNVPFHPEDRQRAWNAWQNATQHKASYSLECRLRRFDGTYRWWLIRGVPQLNAAGETVKWYGTCTDIEQVKQAETTLLESQAILQAAMDNSPAGIAIADAPDGKLRYVNEAGLFIRGGTDKELVKNIGIEQYVASWKILHLDGTPYRSEEVPLARAVLHGEHCSEEFIVRRADNEDRLVWATAAPIKNEQDKITAGIVIFLDVTDKKIAEQNLHARNQELERFNKAAVGRELRMIELKKEVNALCRELRKPVPYPVQNSAGHEQESA